MRRLTIWVERRRVMLDTRTPQRAPATDGNFVRKVAAAILGLASVGILWFLAMAIADIADTYGNITEGGAPLLAMSIGIMAAGFGAGAVALWRRPALGRAVAWVFVSILALAAIIFGVVHVLSDNVILG
jgi:hypothetical protein